MPSTDPDVGRVLHVVAAELVQPVVHVGLALRLLAWPVGPQPHTTGVPAGTTPAAEGSRLESSPKGSFHVSLRASIRVTMGLPDRSTAPGTTEVG